MAPEGHPYRDSSLFREIERNSNKAFSLAKVIADEEGLFLFKDDGGQVFTLRPMTAPLYSARVRSKVGGPELKTDDDVTTFYLAPRGW